MLIRRQFADMPGAAGVKAALRGHVTDLAEAAWQTGGIEFYLSLMKAGRYRISTISGILN